MHHRPSPRKTMHPIIVFIVCLALILQASPLMAGPDPERPAVARSPKTADHPSPAAAPQLQTTPRSGSGEKQQARSIRRGPQQAKPTAPSLASLRAIQSRWSISPLLQKPLSADERTLLYPPAVPGGPNPMEWAGRNRLQPRNRSAAELAAPQVASLPLDAGWRLISIPEEQTDTDPAAVLASIDDSYSKVYHYDGCDAADPWKIYEPGAGGDLTAIDHTKGLWVEMTAADALETSGTVPDRTEIPLCVGWNLIGYPLEQVLPVEGVLHTIAGKYTRVFAWDLDDASDPWDVFDVAVPDWANDLQFMQPGRGYWVYVTEPVTLTITPPGPPPVVTLDNPLAGSEITQPISSTGTITSEAATTWVMEYRTEGESDWIAFAEGGTVAGQAAGIFAPTVLPNDIYEMRLTATDVHGQSASDQVDVLVDGEMKIGLFTISFVDLTVPVAGIPLSFIRTYDSRDKEQGAFGIGWTLDILRGTYKNNRKPGDGWFVTDDGGLDLDPCDVVKETKYHVTEIRFSDVEYYRFKLKLENFQNISGTCQGEARFEQTGGVPGATLTPLSAGNVDATLVRYDTGTDHVVNAEGQIYEPEQVLLTTLDGRQFTLSLTNGLERIVDPNGNSLTITENGVTHSSGKSVHFERDDEGRIAQITDPKGNVIRYTYNADGDLVAHTDQEGHVTRFTYWPGHYLNEIIDPRQIPVTRIEYDDQGRMIALVDADGNRTEFTHNVSDREEIVVDSRNHATRYVYDERGNVLLEESTVTIEGETVPVVTQYEYDERGNVTAVVDPDGVRNEATYDANDQITQSVVDPGGLNLVNRFTYNDRGKLTNQVDPEGRTITYTYDARGNLNGFTSLQGYTYTLQYNAQGRVEQRTDPLGNVTQMTYDQNGYPTSEKVYSGTTTLLRWREFTYDANGNKLSEALYRTVDGVSQPLTVRYEYDDINRPVAVTDPFGNTSRIEYNAFGREAARVDALGRRIEFEYDNLGRLVKTTYPDGTFTTITYDSEGNVASVTDQANRTTRYEYDELNRRVKTILPNGASVERVYTPGGLVAAEIDALGNRTEFDYDAGGRLVKTTLPAIFDMTQNAFVQPEILQEYDGSGNRIAIVEADQRRTAFVYDAFGMLRETVYPDDTRVVREYDALGRLIERRDEENRSIRYAYDALDRLISVTLPLPAPGDPEHVTRFSLDFAP